MHMDSLQRCCLKTSSEELGFFYFLGPYHSKNFLPGEKPLLYKMKYEAIWAHVFFACDTVYFL